MNQYRTMQRILYSDGVIRTFQCRSRNYQHWISDKPTGQIVAKSKGYGTRLAVGNGHTITEYGRTEHDSDSTYKLFGSAVAANYALVMGKHPLRSKWLRANLDTFELNPAITVQTELIKA